ncbi:outer envelope pore protein 16, chloroplastic-like [Panicum miliaceum]|uniref:Outer envelope pore protein 16, chloroplastic-like n=1 Tax=Panicum miliaceum TaxID=4540 RepID=A0A3L6SV21_PANMI|nr:outer envelope pore protein 16, chloroplastic-like [Panicum miliaceum]
MPELAEFWVVVVWLGSRRWWPISVTGSFAARPVLSRAVHAFRNAAVTAACKVAAEDAFHCLTTGGGVPKRKLEHSVSASTSRTSSTFVATYRRKCSRGYV